MSSALPRNYSKSLSEETCESHRKTTPHKISQDYIKHNYNGLSKVPQSSHPKNIRHLYLSHNLITNLVGIEVFVNLESLNLSYNLLERVQEFQRIPSPLKLIHLKIKQNNLPYGNQDYIVSLFQNLATFDDISFNKSKKDSWHKMKQYISQNLLTFYTKVHTILQGFSQIKADNHKTIKKIISFKNEEDNQLFFNSLKQIYIGQTSTILSKISMSRLLKQINHTISIILNANILKKEADSSKSYVQIASKNFQMIFRQIIVKFEAKFDKKLVNYLTKQSQSQKFQQLLLTFSRLGVYKHNRNNENQTINTKYVGGAIKRPLVSDDNGKYIQKISLNLIENHPMNSMVMWKQSQFHSLIQPQKTKWHKFNTPSKPEPQIPLFQRVPIFIYCRQYLQVISQIVFHKIQQILQMENHLVRSQQLQQTEIDLQLSQSEILSFGNPQQEDQFINQSSKMNQVATGLQDRTDRFKVQTQNQMQTLQQKTQLKLKEKKNLLEKEQQYSFNIKKYKIYQINLAFKVFRTLRINLKQNIH